MENFAQAMEGEWEKAGIKSEMMFLNYAAKSARKSKANETPDHY
jgi:hypothetical protein